jgi:hypothetical protein
VFSFFLGVLGGPLKHVHHCVIFGLCPPDLILRWTPDVSQILGLICLMPPRPYEELYGHYLKPLTMCFRLGEPDTRLAVLQCYTNIVKRYASFDWAAYDRAAEEDPSTTDVEDVGWFVSLRRADYMLTISELVAHVDSVCSVAVHYSRTDLPMFDRILTFCEVSVAHTDAYLIVSETSTCLIPFHMLVVSGFVNMKMCQRLKEMWGWGWGCGVALQVCTKLHRKYKLPLQWVPSHSIAYACLLTPALEVVSRFCGVLTEAHAEMRDLKIVAKKHPEMNIDLDRPENDFFNFYLMDFSCML